MKFVSIATGALALTATATALAAPNTQYQLCEARKVVDATIPAAFDQPHSEAKSPDGTLVPLTSDTSLVIADAQTFRAKETYDIRWLFEESDEEKNNPRDAGYSIGDISWSTSARFVMVFAYNRGHDKYLLIDRQTRKATRSTSFIGTFMTDRELLARVDVDKKLLILTDPATQKAVKSDLPGLPSGSYRIDQVKTLDSELVQSTEGDTYSQAHVSIYSIKDRKVRATYDFKDVPGTLVKFDEKRGFAVIQTKGAGQFGAQDEAKLLRLADHRVIATYVTDKVAGQNISLAVYTAGNRVMMSEFPEGEDSHTDDVTFHTTVADAATGQVATQTYKGPYVAVSELDENTYLTQQLSVFGGHSAIFTINDAQGNELYRDESPSNAFVGLFAVQRSPWFFVERAKKNADGLLGFVNYKAPGTVFYNRIDVPTNNATWMEGTRLFTFTGGDAAKKTPARVTAYDLNQNCRADSFRF
jgi:hypothetical protein